jgi:NhaP-type Na+/H+ and K+/H+ antiporter
LRAREILDRVQQLWKLVLPAGLGLVVASLTHVSGLDGASWYLLAISYLLAIGLYGSTYSIDLGEARRDWRTILAAVTIGVILKAALIGVTLALFWRDPLFLVLGVAVAQIDPLAVASILDNPRMSSRAKSILAAWSSFDDPVTVILAVYAATIVASYKGIHLTGSPWVKDLLLNAVFAGAAWLVWRLLRRRPFAVTVLAVALIALAAWQFTFLGLAVAGLFVRPAVGRQVSAAVQAALVLASFMLGLLLFEGVDLIKGVTLGAAAFGAQIVAGFLLTGHLPMADRVHLAFAQQNGITAIILALFLQPRFGGVIAVVAPAILVINLIHLGVNRLIDRRPVPLGTESA